VKISAEDSVKLLAWSGTRSDLQRLAQRVEVIMRPALDAAETDIVKDAEDEERKYTTDAARLRDYADRALDRFRERAQLRVQLSYRRHEARHSGTVEELADVDTRDLAGVFIGSGEMYDRPKIALEMRTDMIEAKVWMHDTGLLVGVLAQLKDELERNAPSWSFARSRWFAALLFFAWAGLCTWWSLRLIDAPNDVTAAAANLVVVGVAVWAFWGRELLRERWFPAFEARDDHGNSPVVGRIKVIGWLVPVALTVLFGLPTFF
jgi:hypothetical protein